MTTTLAFVHGAFLTSLSWENFVPYFETRGYEVIAPEWPRRSKDPEEDREHPEGIAGLGVAEIVDHYDAILRALPEPPVLVGHSFGGLFVELLLDRGLGRAGVALDPAPPKGVLRLAVPELRVASAALAHPSKRAGVVTLTPEQFNYGFTNTFPPEAARAAYERYAVPETGRIFYEGAFATFELHSPLALDYGKPDRAPLLLTAASEDHTVPPQIVHSAFRKYERGPSRADLIEFEGMPHLLMAGGPHWERVAGTVAEWLERVLPAGSRPTPVATGFPSDTPGVD